MYFINDERVSEDEFRIAANSFRNISREDVSGAMLVQSVISELTAGIRQRPDDGITIRFYNDNYFDTFFSISYDDIIVNEITVFGDDWLNQVANLIDEHIGVSVIDISIDNGRLSIDLSPQASRNFFQGSSGGGVQHAKLILTLASLPGVNEITILVNGMRNYAHDHVSFDDMYIVTGRNVPHIFEHYGVDGQNPGRIVVKREPIHTIIGTWMFADSSDYVLSFNDDNTGLWVGPTVTPTGTHLSFVWHSVDNGLVMFSTMGIFNYAFSIEGNILHIRTLDIPGADYWTYIRQ